MMKIGTYCGNGHLLTLQSTRMKTRQDGSIERVCKQCQSEARKRFVKRHPLYDTWRSMIRRCTDPTFKDWHLYGGKIPSISIVDEWLNFEIFCSDMGERPEGYSLERKDSDGPYSKDNCKWASPKEQANHTTRNVYVMIHGETLTVSQWAEVLDIPVQRIYQRIHRGMSPIDAIIYKL